MARAMVTRYGMSEALGPRTYGAHEEMIFLGREISEQRNYGEQVAEQIDAEVKRIISTAYAQAQAVLSTYREQLDAVANRLTVAESIGREELASLVGRRGSPLPSLAAVPSIGS